MSNPNAAFAHDEDLDGPIEITQRNYNQGEATSINPMTRQARPKRQSSFAAVVADLAVGDSATRSHTLNQGMTLAEFERDLKEMKSMIDNNVRPALVNAKKLTGGEYRVETSQTITTAGRIYLLAIVTRIS